MKNTISKKWIHTRLDTIASVQTGISKSDNRKGEVEYLPYLRVANVQDGYIDLSEIKTIGVPKSKIERFLLKKDDILLTEGGDFDKLGRGHIWNGEIPKCVHQNHIFAVRIQDKKKLDPEFLALLFQSRHGKNYFLSCAKQTTNLASINSSQLKLFPVHYPSINVQRKIIANLSIWDSAIEKTENLILEKRKAYASKSNDLFTLRGNHNSCISEFSQEISIRNNGASERVLSVTNHSGFILPEDQFSKRVASADLSNYKVVHKAQFAYNPSRINVGSIARLDTWDTGILSPMYTVFTLNTKKIDSDYFLHWLQSQHADYRIKQCAQGSVRETVSFADFQQIKIPLPNLARQKQIALSLDLMQKEISLLKKTAQYYQTEKTFLMNKLLSGEWEPPELEKEAAT